MKRRGDLLTGDLFEIPQPVPMRPGSLEFRIEIARTMTEALEGRDRYEVAATIQELTGYQFTKASLDAMTAPSREHIPNLERAVAFDLATESNALIGLYATKLGARVIVGEQVLDNEIGRFERIKQDAAERIKQLKQQRARR